jgi:hypothetical protein
MSRVFLILFLFATLKELFDTGQLFGSTEVSSKGSDQSGKRS